jgi:uncharacterized protein
MASSRNDLPLDTTVPHAPRRVYSPVPMTKVVIDDGFWTPRRRTVQEVTLPLQYELCQRTGRIDALKLQWQPWVQPVPHIFWDSDIGKWIEAASYSLAIKPDPELDASIDYAISLLGAAQQEDGYVNSYYLSVEKGKRWTNLRDNHELYCAGHLIEGAVAHYQATGKRSFLDIMCRYVDYIATVFGPNPDQKHGYDGHQEIELALVKLYHATGEEKYLCLSQFFIDERGKQPHFFDIEARERGEDPKDFWAKTYEYNQSIVPAREQTRIMGHAVRAMYYFSAMADLAGELGDESLLHVCEHLWEDLISKRMYITGGIGPSRQNEGFTREYDLGNETAYCETCASCGMVYWNHRMLQLTGNGRYADIMERALYNGVISGIALDGKNFFYENPLTSFGDHHRQEWFDVSCCPPNVARLLGSLGKYIYSSSDDTVAVHLYIQGTADLEIGEQTVKLKQTTNYPWDGTVNVQLDITQSAKFTVKLRIPGWYHKYQVSVNGVSIETSIDKGYISFQCEWRSGDTITLNLEMPVERVYAHPDVLADEGHVALQRGPIVYCLESVDHAVPINRVRLLSDATLRAEFVPDLLNGIVAIKGNAEYADSADWGASLYRTEPPQWKPCEITAIPYCYWDNREPGQMLVWLRSV